MACSVIECALHEGLATKLRRDDVPTQAALEVFVKQKMHVTWFEPARCRNLDASCVRMSLQVLPRLRAARRRRVRAARVR